MSRLEKIPVGEIHPAGDNPRRVVDVDDEMVATMKSLGVLEPLLVNQSKTNGYTLVAGHRRLAAAKKAGLKTVPCIIHEDLTDRERAEMMLVENLQRHDLSPLEEATAYQRLVELGHKQRDLAKIVGRSQSHISKRTALLKLPEAALKAVDAGGISLEQALGVAKLPVEQAAALFAKGKPREFEIDNAIRQHEHDERREALRKELTAAGVKVVERDAVGDIWDHLLRHLNVDEDAHAREPCHAAMLDYGSQAAYLCLEPSRHAPDGDSSVKVRPRQATVVAGETPEQMAKRQKQELERAAELAEKQRKGAIIERRLDFAAGIVAKGDVGDTVDLMALALTSECYIEAATEDATTLRLAGIGSAELGYQERTEKARAFVDESVRNRARFVCASAIAAIETVIDDRYGHSDDDDGHLRRTAAAYFSFLSDRGYLLCDDEKAFAGVDSAEIPDEHEFRITPVGKAQPPKKWGLVCACGFEAQQTTEEMAQRRHAEHLTEVGGLDAEDDA